MKAETFYGLLAIVGTLCGVGGISDSAPVCMVSCWDNSKFVSECMNDNKCLCNDSEFQNAVYQCLHSQCHTAQFAPAVHYALVECFSHGSEVLGTPRLIQQQTSRRRSSHHSGYVSGSASASAGPSGTRRLRNSISAFAHPFPTRSAAGGFERSYNLQNSQSVSAALPPKDSLTYGNNTRPASSAPVITSPPAQFSPMAEPYTLLL